MILAVLALWLAGASGCRSEGASVWCVLAPPVPPLVMPAAPKPRNPIRPVHRRERRPARAAPHRLVPDEAHIQRHVDALIAIGDCTGARTLLTGLGRQPAAASVFAACVGGPAVQ